MSDMPIEQRRAEVSRLSADGLSQRQIAAQLGVDHSTVLRDLVYLRANGAHQPEPVSAVSTVAGAAGVTALADMRDSRDAHQNGAPAERQPWEIERIDPAEQRAQDGQRALQVIIEVGQSGGWPGVRNNLAVDIGRERAENALSDLQRIGHAMQTGGGMVLTPQGRFRLEQAEQATRPKPAPPRPRFADLRQTYVDALPGYRRLQQQRAEGLRAQRWERQQQAERSLTRFIPSIMLPPGWRVAAERDRQAHNILALYPPAFPDLGESGVYVRVQIDDKQDVAWLQSSRGGPLVYVLPNSSTDQVRAALALVFVPAVDRTAEQLPTLDDMQEAR